MTRFLTRKTLLGGGLLLLIVALLWLRASGSVGAFPEAWNFHLRQPIDSFKLWVIGHRTTHPIFLLFFEPLSDTIDFLMRATEKFLLWLPWTVLVLAVFLAVQKMADLRTGLLAAVSLLLMGLMGVWRESMQTLALMTISVSLSLAIGIPLGILTTRYPKLDNALRPILDGMQTMPAFVYLIPVLLFFGIARVPSVIATLIYALPPAIRLTALGIREVPREMIEAAEAFGSTRRQILTKVQLPLAMPSIMLGVNQTIMMALSIVVIAALIGAGGLGQVVLSALGHLEVGKALAAGLAIVFMAVLLDRTTQALAQRRYSTKPVRLFRLMPQRWARFAWVQKIEAGIEAVYEGNGRLLYRLAEQSPIPFLRQSPYATASGLLLVLVLIVSLLGGWQAFPAWRLNVQEPTDTAVRWMRDNLYEYQLAGYTIGTGPLSRIIIVYGLDPLDNLFQNWLTWPILIPLVGLIGGAVSGWRLSILAMLTLLGVGFLGMWQLAMVTFSQVIVAVFLSLLIGLPLGIWSARSNTAQLVLTPILDFLQTIPSFVYLVPIIMLFDVGRVPGIIASVLYALPPAIRLTSLGIRQVEAEAVEAARAFGSTKRQILWKVQLPLALPSIMAGINQTVMMVLAMVVIAGMVGGAGLGLEAVNGLAKNQLGKGIEAGLAIVLLAIVIDRLLLAWSKKQKQRLTTIH